MVVKGTATKVRKLHGEQVIAGFAGSAADGFSLFERFEEKCRDHSGNLLLAAINLAKQWRQDRYLRRLEAMLLVADRKHILTISGSGDVIEAEHSVMAIGSGGGFAQAAAQGLCQHTDLTATQIVTHSLQVAAEMCIYTNNNLTIHSLD